MQPHSPQNTRINWTKTHKTCTWIPHIREPQKRLLNWAYKAIYRSNVTPTKNSMVFFHKNKRKSLNVISDNPPPKKNKQFCLVFWVRIIYLAYAELELALLPRTASNSQVLYLHWDCRQASQCRALILRDSKLEPHTFRFQNIQQS